MITYIYIYIFLSCIKFKMLLEKKKRKKKSHVCLKSDEVLFFQILKSTLSKAKNKKFRLIASSQ